MYTLKEKLGARIKARRKELGLSQEALAELVNMDTPNLSNIERGKRFMTAETLERIAQALKTSERELFVSVNKSRKNIIAAIFRNIWILAVKKI